MSRERHTPMQWVRTRQPWPIAFPHRRLPYTCFARQGIRWVSEIQEAQDNKRAFLHWRPRHSASNVRTAGRKPCGPLWDKREGGRNYVAAGSPVFQRTAFLWPWRGIWRVLTSGSSLTSTESSPTYTPTEGTENSQRRKGSLTRRCVRIDERSKRYRGQTHGYVFKNVLVRFDTTVSSWMVWNFLAFIVTS